jgi:shikimate dehydrogenase
MQEAREQGLDYLYRIIDLTAVGIAPERIGEVLRWARALGYDALNITHPCKRLVMEHLDDIDPLAAAVDAVNTVLFTDHGDVGYNTDTTGFAIGFDEGLPGAPRTGVVMVGAGGAGAAVGDALLRLGAEYLAVVDADLDRATALAHQLGARHADARVDASGPDKLSVLLPASDGVVHCTPTGMAEHPGLPFAADLLNPRLWVADIVYRPLDTELLAAARRAGCRTLDGGHMAVHQATDAFELITGITPDADRMSRHFRSLVG